MLKKIGVIQFFLLAVVYYFYRFGTIETNEIILTVASFLFAIFSGFFMARQSARYSEIREQVASFDGEMNALYRNFGHVGAHQQDAFVKIARKHYTLIKKHSWDYPFMHKTTTITDIHKLLEQEKKTLRYPAVKHLALQSIFGSLDRMQGIRKRMVNLHLERIPFFQWMLLLILGLILLLTVSAIPSTHELIPAVLKSAFGTSIVVILILLYEFDHLQFFEKNIGARSSEDVLAIFAGKK